MMTLEPVRRLIAELGKLPGIGERTAERLAFHLLSEKREEALKLSEAIHDLKEKVRACSVCTMITDVDPCAICSDTRRDTTTLLVVEQTRDIWSIEKSGSYRGRAGSHQCPDSTIANARQTHWSIKYSFCQ